MSIHRTLLSLESYCLWLTECSPIGQNYCYRESIVDYMLIWVASVPSLLFGGHVRPTLFANVVNVMILFKKVTKLFTLQALGEIDNYRETACNFISSLFTLLRC